MRTMPNKTKKSHVLYWLNTILFLLLHNKTIYINLDTLIVSYYYYYFLFSEICFNFSVS